MALRADQKALLFLLFLGVVGLLLDSALNMKLQLDPTLYVSMLVTSFAIFCITNFFAGRSTAEAIKREGLEVETNPTARRMYETGSFRKYRIWLVYMLIMTVVVSYYTLVSHRLLITALLLYAGLAGVSSVDLIHDIRQGRSAQ